MKISENIMRKVKKCNACILRQKIKNKHEKLNIKGSPYYCIYNSLDCKPNFMFIMQNPGISKGEKYKEELKNYEGLTGKSLIKKMDEYFIKWLLNKNRVFVRGFIKTLNNKTFSGENGKCFKEMQETLTNLTKLLKKGEATEKLCGNFMKPFFSTFYVTDLVKCRAKTGWIKGKLKNEKLGKINKPKCLEGKEKVSGGICFDSYLQGEIDKIRPKLIFCFSTRTWEVFREKFEPIPYGEKARKAYERNPKITNVHGYLFEIKKPQTFVIPLVHFSKINNSLRESYFKYMEGGLKTFTNLRKANPQKRGALRPPLSA